MSAVESVWADRIKQNALAATLRVWRTVVAVLLVVSAIVVGVSIPALVAIWFATPKLLGIAFGSTTLLAVIKDLLQTVPKVFEYIKSGATQSLPKLFVEVAIAALGLGIVWYALLRPTDDAGPPLPPPIVSDRPLPIVLNESDALFATYLTFGNAQASIDPDTNPQLVLVDHLIQSLDECVQSDSDRIVLVVRAYASSSGPDRDNEKLYKDRGTFVRELLERRISALAPHHATQFIVEGRVWKSLEIMKIRRLFKDTNDEGIDLPNAGALNRRAEILVRSAGSCLPT